MNVPAERVREQIVAILTAWGMDADLVATTAEVMVETDLSGVDSHGVSMLMDYEQSMQKGKLNLRARPKVVRESPVTALIEADAGLGHPAAKMGMQLAIDKALVAGSRRSPCATRITSARRATTRRWRRGTVSSGW